MKRKNQNPANKTFSSSQYVIGFKFSQNERGKNHLLLSITKPPNKIITDRERVPKAVAITCVLPIAATSRKNDKPV